MELDQEKEPVDVANEPVDRNDDAEFMDTGVLHEDRPCTSCGEKPATKGGTLCVKCGSSS